MKTRILLFFVLILIPLPIFPQISKTLHVALPGELSTLLTEEEKATITDLTITGTIDSADFIFMRDEMPVLSSLDLSGASTVNDAIGHNALGPKVTLCNIILPPTTRRIGREALMSCPIRSLILPPTLEIIQHAAFRYCNLKEITLPASVRIIESTVFASCDSLENIYVEEGSTYFSSSEGVLFNNDKTVLVTFPPGKKGHYLIPPSVTTVYYEAFCGCHHVESICIPASVSTIGDSFYANLSLTGFEVAPDNEYFCDIDGVLFTADTSILVQYPLNRPGNSYSVPYGTETIKDASFRDCDALSHISFPVTLTEIGPSAFRGCRGLISLELPPSVKYIGLYAFGYCSSLQSIRIPSSPETIGRAFLTGAIELDTIIVNSAVPFELSDAYLYFSGIDTNNCVLMVPAGSYEAYSSALHWRSFQNITEYETSFVISQTDFTPAESGEELSFQITSNTEWRIRSDASWLQFSDTIGMDNRTITVFVSANYSGPREADAVVQPLDKEQIMLSFSQTGSGTSVEEIDANGGILNYDPVGKCLMIKDLSGNNLIVFTVEGKLLLNRKINGDFETVDMNSLPEGFYMVRAGSVILKIISSAPR